MSKWRLRPDKQVLDFEALECLQYLSMCVEEGLPFPAWSSLYLDPIAPTEQEDR